MYEKIKELCDVKKTTITALERKLELGNGTIHRWRNGSPTIDKLQKVAEHLGVTIEYLLSENGMSSAAALAAKKFDSLSETQQKAVLQMIESYQCKEKEDIA